MFWCESHLGVDPKSARHHRPFLALKNHNITPIGNKPNVVPADINYEEDCESQRCCIKSISHGAQAFVEFAPKVHSHVNSVL